MGNKVFQSLKNLFKYKRYILLAILIGLFFYLLNAFVSGFSEIISFYSKYPLQLALKLTILNVKGFHYRILTHSLVSLIIISILFGMLISLLIFKTKRLKKINTKKFGPFATTGIFLGVLAPGCVACGVGIASLLGLSAFLSFLPYEGLELSILSIILLLFANYKITKGLLNENVCKIMLPDNHNLKGGK